MTRICVSVCEDSVDAIESAAVRASEWADVVELRLDCLTSLEGFERVLGRISRPVILTLRPAEQGGHRELDQHMRQAFWQTAPHTDWWDIESDLKIETDWSRVIISHHDFAGVPPDLTYIYERLAATPARVIKIAVHAN